MERIGDFNRVMPPTPAASDEGLAWARQMGQHAGAAGGPPIPPAEFAVYNRAWTEGWRAGNGRRKPSGWSSMEIDFDWREHE